MYLPWHRVLLKPQTPLRQCELHLAAPVPGFEAAPCAPCRCRSHRGFLWGFGDVGLRPQGVGAGKEPSEGKWSGELSVSPLWMDRQTARFGDAPLHSCGCPTPNLVCVRPGSAGEERVASNPLSLGAAQWETPTWGDPSVLHRIQWDQPPCLASLPKGELGSPSILSHINVHRDASI